MPSGLPRSVRRSPHLISYWREGTLSVVNYATGVHVQANPLVVQILTFFESWKRPRELQRSMPTAPRALLAAVIGRLLERTLLQAKGRLSPEERAMDAWTDWNPSAGFFHHATRDVPFTNPFAESPAAPGRSPGRIPRVKRIRNAATIPLPRPRRAEPFVEVLRARRSWRDFSNGPVSIDELGVLLHLTAGVQRWENTREGRAALKTSPSGGATHPGELYVLTLNVAGLDRGLYHYRADTNALELIRAGARRGDVERYIPTQWWYRRAAFLVFFTAVFARSMWRYNYARAYRALLIEAGHQCQTFCLTATWLKLAPFCAMALADSVIEKDLGLDGRVESVLYAAGVGRRPPGVTWAPAPRDEAWPGGPPASKVHAPNSAHAGRARRAPR